MTLLYQAGIASRARHNEDSRGTLAHHGTSSSPSVVVTLHGPCGSTKRLKCAGGCPPKALATATKWFMSDRLGPTNDEVLGLGNVWRWFAMQRWRVDLINQISGKRFATRRIALP
jgi:hypothetical protein